jgi:hypothetical protein
LWSAHLIVITQTVFLARPIVIDSYWNEH